MLTCLSKDLKDHLFPLKFQVSKVVKADDCDETTLSRVYESIDFGFLTRLLRSSKSLFHVKNCQYRKIGFLQIDH